MADWAMSAAAPPCDPDGKVRLTVAVDDPGGMLTVTPLAPGKRARIADCTASIVDDGTEDAGGGAGSDVITNGPAGGYGSDTGGGPFGGRAQSRKAEHMP